MIRIGIIGTDNQHAYEYTALINGWDETIPAPLRIPAGSEATYTNKIMWMYGLRLAERGLGPKVPMDDAVVSRIWSHDAGEAARIAKACSVDYVAAAPEDVLIDIDVALILTEDPVSHTQLALAAIKRGIPTYIDKPLASSMDEARIIHKAAQDSNVPWYSGSSLRFDPVANAAADYAKLTIGTPIHYNVVVPRTGRLYMIHAVELLNLYAPVSGAKAKIISEKNRDIAYLELRNGATATLETIWRIERSLYRVSSVGDLGSAETPPIQPIQASAAQLRAIIGMASSGQPPVPAEECLEILRVSLGN